MAIRFTAYIKDHDKVIGLYFKQEEAELNKVCVTIHAIDGEIVVFNLCRTKSYIWETFPQQILQWVRDLQPLMFAYIENKCY